MNSYHHEGLYFNTSHVNVNQTKSCCSVTRSNHFNTSHVNVNLIALSLVAKYPKISIHLMLMLIREKALADIDASLFQYISC